MGDGSIESGVGKRGLAYLEPAVVFTLIMLYIWWLRFHHHSFWMLILGLVLASHAWRGENASSLGFRSRNLRACLEEFAPALVLLALVLVTAGLLLQTTRPVHFEDALTAWMGYLPWGLFQQYLLNGYFLNRLGAVQPPRVAAATAAALFSSAHLPNWFLMLVGFGAAWCCARIWGKYRNLFFLGLAHATVGFLLYLVVPDSISHHLTVGPGWFLH
jgi:membrane protease YdiL (CAAX protease family)